ncbi:MAG: hypothetical protein GY788_32740 [bacterium]|nr:hypothetical protein [bacterium]
MIAAYFGAFIAVIGLGQKWSVTYYQYVDYPLSQSLAKKKENLGFLMNADRYNVIIRDVNNYPSTFYGAYGFTMPRLYRSKKFADFSDREIISVVVEKYSHPIYATCNRQCVLQTNIVSSDFHPVFLDGVILQKKEAFLTNQGNIVIRGEEGKHTLRVERMNKGMIYVSASIWAMLVWFFASLVVFCSLSIFRLREWFDSRTDQPRLTGAG